MTTRSKSPLLALPLLIAALCPHARAAEVYKTVDAEGHVVYTDHADPQAPKAAVQLNKPTPKEAARSAKLQAARKAQESQQRQQQAAAAAKLAKLDQAANAQCDDAQKTFYALKDSTATDSGTALRREQARRAMILACTD